MATLSDSEFRQAIDRICAGSNEAVWDFIEIYGPHIQRVVRNRLHQSLRPKFDSTDFMQMVWASLFTNLEKLAEFREPEKLIGHLANMARNKVVDETRRRCRYQKFNIGRESSLENATESQATRILKNETPSGQIMAREKLQAILDAKPERDRQVLSMRMAGATFDQISEALNISERTARQVMIDLERALETKNDEFVVRS